MSEKYKYSPESTVHRPLELHEDGNIHTWTLELNGEPFHVTREVWEAYHADNAALSTLRLMDEIELRHGIHEDRWGELRKILGG